MTCVLCLFWEIPYAAKQAGVSHVYLIDLKEHAS
jgi:hypothetical protein